jgi:hypothetical protein
MTRLSERNNQTTGGPYAQEDYADHAFCCFSRGGRHGDRARSLELEGSGSVDAPRDLPPRNVGLLIPHRTPRWPRGQEVNPCPRGADDCPIRLGPPEI